MAKVKSRYICSECGAVHSKWVGRCNECGAWSSISEEMVEKKKYSNKVYVPENRPLRLPDIEGSGAERYSTGIDEFDMVLGGGLVRGSVVLLGGEPGVGKSTILLSVTSNLSKAGKRILYSTGEESPHQIKLRADRLGVGQNKIEVMSTTKLEDLLHAYSGGNVSDLDTIAFGNYDVIVIDSIQTLASQDLMSAGGTVSQVRQVTYALSELAKTTGVSIIIVGQITKDGSIAGPKVLEHLVDTVLYFEGEYTRGFRILRAVKNRFGSTNEVGVFEMTTAGLREASSDIFLSEPSSNSGLAYCPTYEGSRAFLVEIQSLVAPTFFQYPKRNSNGYELNRLTMLVAVMEKKLGLNLSNSDIYLNVAGGLRISETAADLAVCASLLSSYKEKPIEEGSTFIGEVGLTGEVRSLANIDARANEAKKHGFNKIYLPKDCEAVTLKGVKTFYVKDVSDLMDIFRR